MKTLLMTGIAAAAAMTMAPAAMADDHMDMDVELTTQQQAMYDGWPAENRATYDAWPAEVRTYYWTLTEPQMMAWWQLNDEQRVAIYEMDPAQRTATWNSIARQVAERSATGTVASTAATSASTRAPRAQAGEVVQTTPASARAKGEYPICRGDVQDSCIQPRAAGKNWGNRPLDYWPGQPASQMKKGKK